MKTGQTLIQLAQHKVDSVQTLIRAAEQAREELVRRRGGILEKIERERAVAERDPAAANTYVAYIGTARVQVANIDASIAGVDDRIEALREQLAEAFEEKKRFEMMEERRIAREDAAEAKRLQAAIDEAATMRAARLRRG
ncbi:MAG: flagellar export protein FliJ [Hyphomonadaceae bacterium]|jgi:flagellar export protein FliJ|nr:flagellar export protein FliJ [Hyphomonadaceae bacterium]